jgi:L-Ala-D/L-Glu epimerase
MQIHIQTFTVHKRFALTISRGTTAQSTNIWITVEQDGIEGWGEAAPFSIGEHKQTTEQLVAALEQVVPKLAKYSPLDRQQIEQILIENQVPSAARAGIDTALHDWMGKKVGLPLWQIWGLNRCQIVPTSVTIGINSPQGAKQRVQDWLQVTNVQVLKVKLGNPDGIEADKAMLFAVLETAPNLEISIDANGGWSLDNAIKLCNWLAELGIKYVEQPLAKGQETELVKLKELSPLPIFVDESCFTSEDIPKLAQRVDGINIKLMKAGGLSEVMRMIYVARSHNLKIMFGCYSDSTLANTAMAHLAPLADYLDLDSHLNLTDDPFIGASMQNGCLIPNDLPGLGITRL